MRHHLVSTLLIAGLAVPAAAQDDARKIIDKAIEAHGGATVLSKFPAGRVKTRGTLLVRGKTEAFTSQSVYQMPDRIRVAIEMTVQGTKWTVVQTQQGQKSSLFAGGLEQQVSDAQAQEMKTAIYAQNLARLVPLRDAKYQLAATGEESFDGHAVQGVRVSAAGSPEVKLYFDSKTMLLSALERPGFDSGGAKMKRLDAYSDYRTADGLKYAAKTRVKKDGTLLLESEVLEFKPLEKVDLRQLSGVP